MTSRPPVYSTAGLKRVPDDANSYMCACRLTDAFFVNEIDMHLQYFGRDEFLKTYKDAFKDTEYSCEQILEIVEKQLAVRKSDLIETPKRRDLFLTEYERGDPEIYRWSDDFLAPELAEFVSEVRKASQDSGYDNGGSKIARVRAAVQKCVDAGVIKIPRKDLYLVNGLKADICERLSQELARVADSGLQRSRPNSMNNYGIIMREIGFDHFIDGLVDAFAALEVLFPLDCDTIDSWRAFTVHYNAVDGDKGLALHYDNAEVTFNVNIGGDWEGGEVTFYGLHSQNQDNPEPINLALGEALFHYGKDKHLSKQVTKGDRRNLIIWCRSSNFRNDQCPLCLREPQLTSSDSVHHEGFTKHDSMYD